MKEGRKRGKWKKGQWEQTEDGRHSLSVLIITVNGLSKSQALPAWERVAFAKDYLKYTEVNRIRLKV